VVLGSTLPSRVGGVRYSDPVDLAVVLTTFVVVFPAELPDKSLFAGVVLAILAVVTLVEAIRA